MTATERLTIQKVKTELDTHLHDHDIKIDPKLHDVYHAVLDEGGLRDEVGELKGEYKNIDKRLSSIEDTLKWLVRLVLGAVILAVLGLVFIQN